MATPATAHELIQAISLAEASFTSARAVGDYLLVRAERLLADDEHCSGPACWQLVFKLSRLLPGPGSPRLGAGGELFFVVDVDEGRALLTGHGE